MNKIFLTGRITKNLELKATSTGKSVCEFTIAVNRDKEHADFINVIVWNAQAENLTKYQSKGSLIAVVGELRVDIYTKQDGTKGYKNYVLANNIEYLENYKHFGNCLFIENGDVKLAVPLSFGIRIVYLSYKGSENLFFEQPSEMKDLFDFIF